MFQVVEHAFVFDVLFFRLVVLGSHRVPNSEVICEFCQGCVDVGFIDIQ